MIIYYNMITIIFSTTINHSIKLTQYNTVPQYTTLCEVHCTMLH